MRLFAVSSQMAAFCGGKAALNFKSGSHISLLLPVPNRTDMSSPAPFMEPASFFCFVSV